jgi:hypothetical protein
VTSLDISPSNSAPAQQFFESCELDPVRNRIIVFGGRGTGALHSNRLLLFDLATRFWSSPTLNAPLPPGRYDPRMLHVPGQKSLYIGGGCASNTSNMFPEHVCQAPMLNDLWLGNMDAATMGF